MTRCLPARLAVAAFAIVVLALLAHVQAQKPASQAELLLGRALNLEDVAGNLKDAIATYEQVLKAPDATRAQKARAQFRIGACYERLGVDGARKAYEVVVSQYGDQGDLAAQARARLAALGGGVSAARGSGAGPSIRVVWSKQDWWDARISPDGTHVAFVDNATANLWVRNVATGSDRNLTNTPREKAWVDFPLTFSWSHDGSRLAYDWFAEGGEVTEIRVVDVRTGAISKFEATRTVNTGRPSPAAFSGPHDWSPDDSRILVTIGLSSNECRLGWVSVKDGTVTELKATRGEALNWATVSPDGLFIAYAARRGPVGDRDVHIARSDGTGASLLIGGPDNDAPVAWTLDGTGLIYQGNRAGNDGLWVVRLSGGKAVGEPVAVPGVGRILAHGLTRSGALLYTTGGQIADLRLATVDLAAGNTLDRKTVDAPGGSAAYSMGSYSPDGALMTYDVRVGNRMGFAISRADGGQPRLFIPAIRPGSSTPPTWSGDSRTVFRDGTFDPSMRAIFRVDVQSGAMEPLFPPFKIDTRASGDQPSTMIGVSADGKTAYYQKRDRDTRKSSVWSRDVGTGQEKELFRPDGPAGLWSCGLSPDGKRLLFTLNPVDDTSPRELKTLSFEDGSTTTVCRLDGAVMSAAWSPDARHVVFAQRKSDASGVSSWELCVVEAGGGKPRSIGIVHPVIRGVAVHPDGKHIAYVTSTLPNQETWLLENFLPPMRAGTPAKAAAPAKTPKKEP